MFSSIDKVQFVEVSSELMKTAYDFTVGWEPGVGAKQIHILLVHLLAVITPVKYAFAQIDPPAAMSDGKWVYYEESYEDMSTNNQTAVRCVLDGCFWNEDSTTVFQKTGQQTSNSVTLYIPYSKEITGRQYITPDEWNKLDVSDLDKYWTIDPHQLPLMVKGENGFEFDWSVSTAVNRIATQEQALMTANPEIRRAVDINKQFFGSKNLWHIVVRC